MKKKHEYSCTDQREVGHVRRYEINYAQRISLIGFEVSEVSVTEFMAGSEIKRFGLSREPVFFATK